MDDVFQYLIYLFIIISFLASLFKKKDKPQTKTDTQTYTPPVETNPQPKSSQQEEYDILREIEKMFKTELPTQAQTETNRRYDEEDSQTFSEHVKTDDWHEKTQSEHITTISEHIPENLDVKKTRFEGTRKPVNEKIIKQAEAFEKRLKEKSYQRGDTKNTLIEKLKHPQALKDYIIISEILGKPKALQE